MGAASLMNWVYSPSDRETTFIFSSFFLGNVIWLNFVTFVNSDCGILVMVSEVELYLCTEFGYKFLDRRVFRAPHFYWNTQHIKVIKSHICVTFTLQFKILAWS